MLIAPLVYVAVAWAFVWCFSKIKNALIGPLASVPGSWHSRFTRFAVMRAALQGDRTKYVHKLHEKYGPIVRVRPNEVDICDISEVKAVHRVASPYLKDRKFYDIFTGKQKFKSLFAMTEPSQYSTHRRMLSANMADSWMKTMEPFVQKTVQTAVSKMHRDFQQQGYFDAYRWFMFMATDSLGESAFGKSFETLQNEEDSQYMKDIRSVGQIGILRVELGSLDSIVQRIPMRFMGELKALYARTAEYSDQSISRYLKMSAEKPDSVIPTLLSKEYKAVQEGSVPYDQLKRDGVGFIIAGTDTTGLTCTQAVWLISQYPEVHARLVEQVAKLPADFTDKELRRIPYIQHVINEVLRIAGPANDRLPRVVPAGGATISGHFLPEGTTITSQAYTLHRNPEVFPDPLKFDPSRWEAPTNEMKEAFMAFGGGSRICLGMHFALQEIRHALATFYRTFQQPLTISTAEGFTIEEMEPKSYFLLTPKGHRCLLTRASA